jgi:integrase
LKGQELLKFESVKNWLNSLNKSAQKRGKKGISKNGKGIRLGRLWEYTNEGKLNPDELLKEAKQDIKLTGKRLDDYFEARKKRTTHNTALTALSFIRGFYTHNEVSFPRSITLPKKLEAKVAVDDEKVSFYDFDEETEEIVFKNGTLQQFVQNLNFRDQTIALCLLSTGADAKDLLNLKVGFVKDMKGELCKKKRFFWHGTRAKTGEPFRTFFSEEATHFLKRYVEQERANANDDEPLFVQPQRTYTRQNPTTKEMETITEDAKLDNYALSVNFREAAKKMGYTKKGELSPFRPKRFRHLFRTACGIAEIDPGYTKAMMGHANDVSAGYLEKDPAIFKKIYVKVEPFLTVFGVNKGLVDEMSHEVNGLKDNVVNLVKKDQQREADIKSLNDQIKTQQSQLARAIRYISQLTEEIENRDKTEAEEDFRKLVEEITKEYPVPKKVKSK